MPVENVRQGGCHCGAVRYEVRLSGGTAENDGLGAITECNCSICAKRGLLLAFVPGANFNLLTQSPPLTDYQFGKKHIHHQFCTICGIESFANGAAPDGGQMYAVNVRCLDGIDAATLKTTPFDGKSL